MQLLQKIYRGLFFWTRGLQHLLLLGLRLTWGSLFAVVGWQKIGNIETVVSFFESAHIPYHFEMAWFVALTEFVGGILLVLGFLSRLSALALTGVMCGAYYFAHWDSVLYFFSDPKGFTEQPPFLYLLSSLIILAFGPGKVSLDYLFCCIDSSPWLKPGDS